MFKNIFTFSMFYSIIYIQTRADKAQERKE